MSNAEKNIEKENRTVTKPTLVARQEFIDNMLRVINESGVPLFIIHPILESLTRDIDNVVKQQYEQEKNQYEAALVEKTDREELQPK